MRLLEFHIESENVKRSFAFYRELLPHIKTLEGDDQSILIFEDGTAFGIWRKGYRGIHQGRGAEHLHFAFQILPEEYEAYKEKLLSLGVEPLEHKWKDGRKNLYFFDPDGHQGEFMSRDWLGRS